MLLKNTDKHEYASGSPERTRRVRTGVIGSLFAGFQSQELRIDNGRCTLFVRDIPSKEIALSDVDKVSVNYSLAWANIKVISPAATLAVNLLPAETATKFVNELKAAIGEEIISTLIKEAKCVENVAHGISKLLKQQRYIANHDIESLKRALSHLEQSAVANAERVLRNAYFPEARVTEIEVNLYRWVIDVISGTRETIRGRNERFIENEMSRFNALFDSIESTPLTREQRVAAIVMEDRQLLAAAAGSGKTSTIVGKIGYLIASGQFRPEDMLVLAFNREAAKEIETRASDRISKCALGSQEIQAMTFHALGNDILAEVLNKKASVSNSATSGEISDAFLFSQITQELTQTDQEFALDWVMFRALYPSRASDPSTFQTLEAWNRYVRSQAEYSRKQTGLTTLNGEVVKSQGELAIANWLYLHSVEYEYERPYKYETANRQYSQYRPDFYFPAIDTYLEHYALDRHGQPPAAFGEKYLESMRWKQHLHATKATNLITTTFAEYISGELFEKLKGMLEAKGVTLKRRPLGPVLARLEGVRATSKFGGLFRTVLKHAKSNELDIHALRSKATISAQPHRSQLFLKVFEKFFAQYQDRLKRTNEIDFEDMIVSASRALEAGLVQRRYKVILVDEFQDISQSRARLLKALLRQAPDCKLFAVGDDWQSINRFAGADLSLFTDFQEHFGVSACNFLTQTFRSNQGITNLASRFIQRNPRQVQRSISAHDKRETGVWSVYRYKSADEQLEICETLLETLSAQRRQQGTRATVFILHRYRHQAPSMLEAWRARFREDLTIDASTIHRAKGKQADYVILLGLTSGAEAFPSEIEDDPLLELVMPVPECFPNSEERRLFYVALTRAQHHVFLLGSVRSPSTFLTELLADKASRSMLRAVTKRANSKGFLREECPECDSGVLLLQKGRYGEFMGCSGHPDCNYTKKISSRRLND